MLKTEDPP